MCRMLVISYYKRRGRKITAILKLCHKFSFLFIPTSFVLLHFCLFLFFILSLKLNKTSIIFLRVACANRTSIYKGDTPEFCKQLIFISNGLIQPTQMSLSNFLNIAFATSVTITLLQQLVCIKRPSKACHKKHYHSRKLLRNKISRHRQILKA